MRKLLFMLLAAMWFSAGPVRAQGIISGNLTAQSTTCVGAPACLSITLSAPGNAQSVGSVSVVVSGTFSGTVQFEATADGTNWVGTTGYPIPTGAGVTSATAAGTWVFNVAAMNNFRVRCSTFSSGPISVSVKTSTSISRKQFDNLPGTGTVTSVGTNNGLTGGTITDSGTIGLANPAVFPGSLRLPTYADIIETAAPSNPASGRDRIYTDSTSHELSCLTSAGANCMPPGMAIGGAITSATAGSVLFVDSMGQLGQDNANLFWDTTNKFLGLGTNTLISTGSDDPGLQIAGHNGSKNELDLLEAGNANAILAFLQSRGTVGTPTNSQNGDIVGQIMFGPYDGTYHPLNNYLESDVTDAMSNTANLIVNLGGATLATFAKGTGLIISDQATSALTTGTGLVSFGDRLLFTGTIPTINSCGATATLVAGSTNSSGIVDLGASAGGPAACSISFSSNFSSTPSCTATPSANMNTMYIPTVSTSGVTFDSTSAFADNLKIYYHCFEQ